MSTSPGTARRAVVLLVANALLFACGGGGSGGGSAATPEPPAPAPTTLSGSVAVGAPLVDGTLRILDAAGNVVAENVPIAADGTYDPVTLTGDGPYRLEACGYSGADYRCVYGVAEDAGTANVTPLTTALMLLAAGTSPDAAMEGSADAFTPAALDRAQEQLRTGLAGVLADADVAPDIDFVTAPLDAGSRSGYDRVLDAVGVSTGEDEGAFVQITPRLGSGNLYLQTNSSEGSITVDADAGTLDLAALEALFEGMTGAAASEAACFNAQTGMANYMASSARVAFGGERIQGAQAVGALLCTVLSGAGEGDGNGESLYGARFGSPVLGRCDLSGAAPVCRVAFALRLTDGTLQALPMNFAVTREGGAWKFLGNFDVVGITASAHVQRQERIDGGVHAPRYERALAIEVPALPGLACAEVSQRESDGGWTRMVLYKPHGAGVRHLSVWRNGNDGGARSLDPATGATREGDDTQVMLPADADGDALVRNFYRGGRTVMVSLYADDTCSTPYAFEGADGNAFEVDVEGVPPVASALANLPWPELDDATRNALVAFAAEAGSDADFTASWFYRRGPLGLNDTLFCAVDRGSCGQGGAGRIADHSLRGGTLTTTLVVHTGDSAVSAGEYKLFSLFGRNAEGLGVQVNYESCPAVPAGDTCFEQGPLQ